MLRIGTCSWKYESWKDLVYSPDCSNYLAEYSRQFNTVEIDQWFWSLSGSTKPAMPQRAVVEEYVHSVPDDFRFTIKIPNSITLTHFYQKDKSGSLVANPYFLDPELFSQFLDTLKPMKDKLGPLMFQFEYLNKQKMSGLPEFIKKFETFIKSIDRNFEYGIELRNPYYLKKEYFEFLRRNNVCMVFLQGYFMNPVWEVFETAKPFLENTIIIRLHGEDRKGIEERSGGIWDQILMHRDAELVKLKEMLAYLQSKEVDIYLNVNNHYEGSAPRTIQKILSML